MADRDEIATAQRLAALVESSDDAIVSKDLDGTIRSWNRSAERLFGFTAGEAIGQPLAIVIPPALRAEAADNLRRIGEGGAVEPFETLRQHKDGTTIPVVLTVSPIRDAGGLVLGASMIARDIRKVRHADSLVADLHRRLLSLVAASGSLVGSPRLDDVMAATVKLATELVEADACAIRRLKPNARTWTVSSAIGLSPRFTERIISAGLEAGDDQTLSGPIVAEDVFALPATARHREAYAAEGIQSLLVIPLAIGAASGTLALYYRTPHRFGGVEVQTGSALGNLAAAAITTAELYDEQRRSRERTERANQRSTFLAEAGTVLASSVDYESTLAVVASLAVPLIADWCTVDLINDAGALERVAWAHGDPRRAHEVRAVWAPAVDEPDARYSPQAVIASGRAVLVPNMAAELAAVPPADPARLRALLALDPASCMAAPLIAHGRTLGAISFATSDPLRRYDEEDLRFAEHVGHRAALAVDNARAYRAVSAANRAKDEFLATLSHELRTPLNAVLGWVQMLRNGGMREDRRAHALEVIERNAEAQVRLVEDMLDVSRIITGKFLLDVHEVDLPATIDAALEAVYPAATAKGIFVQKVLDLGAGPVRGDAGRLQQAIWNLVANAVKFTPSGGRVQVTLRQSDKDVEIEVADSGRGLPPDVMPFVFDRFRQADSSLTRGYTGLGLGLAIVRHIVELHGGSVRAASAGEEQGATFTIALPLGTVRRPTESSAPPAAMPEPLSQPVRTRDL